MENIRYYAKELYSKEVILKAAYAFTDRLYIHLDADATYYKVRLISKEENKNEKKLYAEFENELIAQETRRVIAEQTKNIREMIIARALSSTIVNNVEEANIDLLKNEDAYAAEEILQDWFDVYEKKKRRRQSKTKKRIIFNKSDSESSI